MPRFFKEFFEDAPFLDGEDHKHVSRSLRMRPGEKLTVSDTFGTDFECEISSINEERVELKVISRHKNETEPSVAVTLFQCLPKGDKMDTIVRQAVESGAARIVPVISANCISRPDEKTLAKKTERWQKISAEAAGQSGRGIIPAVEPCITLSEAAKRIKDYDRCCFCYELGGKPIEVLGKEIKTVSFIIGPEGGFTAAEAELLEKNGAVTTTLGKRIFRAETAPVAALAMIMLQSGNV